MTLYEIKYHPIRKTILFGFIALIAVDCSHSEAQDKYPPPTIFPSSHVFMQHSRGDILFDSCNVTHSDAREVGVLLEKVNYFKRNSADSSYALFYKKDETYTINIFFYSPAVANSPKVISALKSVLKVLHDSHSNRKYVFDLYIFSGSDLQSKIVALE